MISNNTRRSKIVFFLACHYYLCERTYFAMRGDSEISLSIIKRREEEERRRRQATTQTAPNSFWQRANFNIAPKEQKKFVKMVAIGIVISVVILCMILHVGSMQRMEKSLRAIRRSARVNDRLLKASQRSTGTLATAATSTTATTTTAKASAMAATTTRRSAMIHRNRSAAVSASTRPDTTSSHGNRERSRVAKEYDDADYVEPNRRGHK